MKKRIIIICRHGKSNEREDDINRIINQDGIEETKDFTEVLITTLKERFDITMTSNNTVFICSPAKRTVQTMEIMLQRLNIKSYETDEKLYSLHGNKKHFNYLEEKIVSELANYEIVFIMAHDETAYFLTWVTKGKQLDDPTDIRDPAHNLLGNHKNPYIHYGLNESHCFICDCDNPELLRASPYGLFTR